LNCDPLDLAARKNKSRNSEPLEKRVPSIFVEMLEFKGISMPLIYMILTRIVGNKYVTNISRLLIIDCVQ